MLGQHGGCLQGSPTSGRDAQVLLLNLFRLSRLYRSPVKAFMIPEYAGRLRLVTPRFIHNANALGMQVHVWTVNELDDMRRLMELLNRKSD